MMAFKELIAKIKSNSITSIYGTAYDVAMVKEFFHYLQQNKSVTSLDLRGVVLKTVITELVQFLKYNTQLQDLTVRPATPEEVKTIYDAISKHDYIEDITLINADNMAIQFQDKIIGKCAQNRSKAIIRSIRNNTSSINLGYVGYIAATVFDILQKEQHQLDNIVFETYIPTDILTISSSVGYKALLKYIESGNFSTTKMTITSDENSMNPALDNMLKLLNSLSKPICLEEIEWKFNSLLLDPNTIPDFKRTHELVNIALSKNKLRFRQELFILLSSPKMHVLLSGYDITKIIFNYINGNDIKFTDKELVATRYPVKKIVKPTIKITENKEQNENMNVNKKAITFAYGNQAIAICKRPSMKAVFNSCSSSKHVSFPAMEVKGLLNQTYQESRIKDNPEALQYRCDILKLIAKYSYRNIIEQERKLLV